MVLQHVASCLYLAAMIICNINESSKNKLPSLSECHNGKGDVMATSQLNAVIFSWKNNELFITVFIAIH